MNSSLPSTEEVVEWLKANKYETTALELLHEQRLRGEPTNPSLLNYVDSQLKEKDVSKDVNEALHLYKKLARDTKDLDWLSEEEQICGSPRDSDVQSKRNGNPRTKLSEGATVSGQENSFNVEENKMQFSKLIQLLAECLPTLISSIDPVHKEALLPLLRIVAIHGVSTKQKGMARQKMITLFKRPASSKRGLIIKEWIAVVKSASAKCVEQEIVPELYSLVNAKTEELKLLALECTEALADLPFISPKIRLSLCQGLLRPFGDDESSLIRSEISCCIVALWQDPIQASLEMPDEMKNEAQMIDSLAADLLDLLFKLALDGFSNSVRRSAQNQIREVIYPKFVAHRKLLSECFPMLFSLISMEITNLSVSVMSAKEKNEQQKGPNVTQKYDGTVVSLVNMLSLVHLSGNAMNCLKAELCNLEEQLPSEKLEALFSFVSDQLVNVVLPSLYSLFTSALQCMKHFDQKKSVMEKLSYLVTVVASLANSLDGPSWDKIFAFLSDSILSIKFSDDHSLESDGSDVGKTTPLGVGIDISTVELANVNLLIFYLFCIRVAGEQASFLEKRHTISDFAQQLSKSVTKTVAETFLLKNSAPAMITFDARIDIFCRAVSYLESMVLDSEYVAAGIMAVIWCCSESEEVTQRLHAVTLVTRTCSLLSQDSIKTTFICTPLLMLLNDPDPTVQEMTIKAFLFIVSSITDTKAQEKILHPALLVVEASGCTSDITQVCLRQWERLMMAMPAEPRETFLYQQLNYLIHQLITKKAEIRQLPNNHSGTTAAQVEAENERWERTVGLIINLLTVNLRCPVVTPWMVSKYLSPSIRKMKESDALLGNAPTISSLRTKWYDVMNLYEAFIEKNSNIITQNATNLLNRFRDEFIKRF